MTGTVPRPPGEGLRAGLIDRIAALNEAIEAAKRLDRRCEVMHDAYEAAAAEQGWETQERSRVAWADVPEANQRTMRIAVRALMADLAAHPEPTPAAGLVEVIDLHAAIDDHGLGVVACNCGAAVTDATHAAHVAAEVSAWVRGQREAVAEALHELPTCATLCDPDCPEACHECHQVRWKREHDIEDCPGRSATDAAIAALLGEGS